MCINTYSFDYLVQSLIFDGCILKKTVERGHSLNESQLS